MDKRDVVYDLAFLDTLCYMAAGYSGVRIVNLADKSNPVEFNNWPTPSYTHGVAFAESTLCIADCGMYFADYSNPLELSVVSVLETEEPVMFVETHETLVRGYLFRGKQIYVDITDIDSPQELMGDDTTRWYKAVAKPETVFVAESTGLAVYDDTDQLNRKQIGSLRYKNHGGHVARIGPVCFVSFERRKTGVIDVSNPAFPTWLSDSTLLSGFDVRDLSVIERFVFVPTYSGLQVLDLQSPTKIGLVASSNDSLDYYRIQRHENHLYASVENRLLIFDVTEFTH